MDSQKDIEALEKLVVQLQGLHDEISQLAKKSPNDGLNKFKLKIVNKVLVSGNEILKGRYRPFDDFSVFAEDDLPTNSDVTMILTQYIEQAERFRSDNVIYSAHRWQYILNGVPSNIDAKMATKVGGDKK
ncbi:hypothetical protein [Jiella pacifica]|uniref:Uncharacterized protein n=1 Tax=Jiella pacifica TaxID=2696469 RepID=A0A6N9T527_9HYPH|nr:hypothetical protein [Jiella pacifica]NDW06494.1 hypothetical protein [Jiella pacifica]